MWHLCVWGSTQNQSSFVNTWSISKKQQPCKDTRVGCLFSFFSFRLSAHNRFLSNSKIVNYLSIELDSFNSSVEIDLESIWNDHKNVCFGGVRVRALENEIQRCQVMLGHRATKTAGKFFDIVIAPNLTLLLKLGLRNNYVD